MCKAQKRAAILTLTEILCCGIYLVFLYLMNQSKHPIINNRTNNNQLGCIMGMTIIWVRKFAKALYYPLNCNKHFIITQKKKKNCSLYFTNLSFSVFSYYLGQPHRLIKLNQSYNSITQGVRNWWAFFLSFFAENILYAMITTKSGVPWASYLHINPLSFPLLSIFPPQYIWLCVTWALPGILFSFLLSIHRNTQRFII